MVRPTIRDIAAKAQVSPAAVSFALNGREGVSEQTRERIIAVARDLKWEPSRAARALSSSRAGAVGLVVNRDPDVITAESFYFDFIVGVERELAASGTSLMLSIATSPANECEILQSWSAQQRVDGVILVDPVALDPRPALLEQLQLPYVYTGEELPPQIVDGIGGSVSADDAAIMATLVTHLRRQGARAVGYVSGSDELLHVQRRRAGLEAACKAAGLGAGWIAASAYTSAAGARATREILASDQNLDALVFDNEALALGGWQQLNETGRKIGTELRIASFEDSPLCQILNPPLTAVVRKPQSLGQQAAAVLMRVIEGNGPRHVRAEAADLVVRASSAS